MAFVTKTENYERYWQSLRGKKQSKELIQKRVAKISGRNSGQYKHGKYCKNICNYCINCGIKISSLAKRCKSYNYKIIGKKISLKIKGKNNGQYKDGHTAKIYYCIDCGKEVSGHKNKRCWDCYIKTCSKKENHFYGKHHNEESKKKISLAGGGTGIPYENTDYGIDFTNVLKKAVRYRDKYKCQLCGCSQSENEQLLDVHHIDYNKFNNALKNLLPLCRFCHPKTNFNRPYWTEYFKELLSKELNYE